MTDSAPASEVPSDDRARLQRIWHAVARGEPIDHTSVVVPSLSFDTEELAKISGAHFYEERLLFTLMRLRNPNARVIYITALPVHPDVVDYYLQLLPGVTMRSARSRLELVCLWDGGIQPLTAKILARPRLIERLERMIGDRAWAYLTVFNATATEKELARRLDIPLNGVDPDLLWLGSKSGCRKVFAEAGVAHAPGFEDVRTEDQVVAGLAALVEANPAQRRAVVKLNDSFAGAGNALFVYPRGLPTGDEARRGALRSALQGLQYSDPASTYDRYMAKLATMGGIVEAFIEAEHVESPSVQMRLDPDGRARLISSHDQVLGGSTGQTYLGCRFPARSAYRGLIQDEAAKVAEVLRRYGVISRFAVDFLVTRNGDDTWQAHAIEINLRMGGTTPPFQALEFLTGGKLDEASGIFHTPGGTEKFYRATDALSSPHYRGLLPEDLFDIVAAHGLSYRPNTETGTIFHMIGALSQFGKVGVTCIGNSMEQAESLYEQVVAILDEASAASVSTLGVTGTNASLGPTVME